MSSLAGKQGPRYRHTAEDGAPYETITLDKLTPIIGATRSGVVIVSLVEAPQPTRPSDEIYRALAENLVIFFRDQQLSRRSSTSPSAASSASCTSIRPRRMRPWVTRN